MHAFSDDTLEKEEIIDDEKPAEIDPEAEIAEEETEVKAEITEDKPQAENAIGSDVGSENEENKEEVGKAAKAELLAKLIKIADTPKDSKQLENNDSTESESEEDDGRLEDDEEEEEMMPIDEDENLEIDIDLMGAHLDKQVCDI